MEKTAYELSEVLIDLRDDVAKLIDRMNGKGNPIDRGEVVKLLLSYASDLQD